ncbi:MAG: sigma-54 dependent transcriptional regulator [Lentimicrobiaceae bacterium]|jgi:transcriptional regulator with PAS, ATPase and Fis domain|nr:sigma-54 dependent transcriptional regulator [Lentimicrobiaceae bacterium]
MEVQAIKQRFGIIGNDSYLERAIQVAVQVATTDLTVLITGESGTGKEVFPKIIHQFSARKHGPYIAVNCGAIPEGTIDSELFGHEKGSFTGAHDARKGYFEVADGGTIFLDEVADLPLSTQVRLLRVLESGEFFRVGSSKVIKTDVRVVAATNVDITTAIQKGKFREDLFYRLNTVPIRIPSLRERKDDILLLFKKFASDFAEKYRMPTIHLENSSVSILENYRWPGNIRQLKNITEQISIIEENRQIKAETLQSYLPQSTEKPLPVIYREEEESDKMSDRDILYKVLFDMRKDLLELRQTVDILKEKESSSEKFISQAHLRTAITPIKHPEIVSLDANPICYDEHETEDVNIIETENLSLEKTEIDLIKKALEKYKGRRKNAAKELGISERTLYRKINEYGIDL